MLATLEFLIIYFKFQYFIFDSCTLTPLRERRVIAQDNVLLGSLLHLEDLKWLLI